MTPKAHSRQNETLNRDLQRLVRCLMLVATCALLTPTMSRAQIVQCDQDFDAEHNDLRKACMQTIRGNGGSGTGIGGGASNQEEAAAESWYCTALTQSLMAQCGDFPKGKSRDACIAAAKKRTENNCKGPNSGNYSPGEGDLTPTASSGQTATGKAVGASCTQDFRTNYAYCGTLKNSKVLAACRSLTGSVFNSCNKTLFKQDLTKIHP